MPFRVIESRIWLVFELRSLFFREKNEESATVGSSSKVPLCDKEELFPPETIDKRCGARAQSIDKHAEYNSG
jgi:hypothetical protein